MPSFKMFRQQLSTFYLHYTSPKSQDKTKTETASANITSRTASSSKSLQAPEEPKTKNATSSSHHHRSSRKSSTYEHTPAHSAATLVEPEDAANHFHNPSASSLALVSVATIGDDTVTISTCAIEEGDIQNVERRNRQMSLQRDPTVSSPIVYNPAATTSTETKMSKTSSSEAQGPVHWKPFKTVERGAQSVRTHIKRREARKGKRTSTSTTDESEPENRRLRHAISHATSSTRSITRQMSAWSSISPRASLSSSPTTPMSSNTPKSFLTWDHGKSQSNADMPEHNFRKDSAFSKKTSSADMNHITITKPEEKKPSTLKRSVKAIIRHMPRPAYFVEPSGISGQASKRPVSERPLPRRLLDERSQRVARPPTPHRQDNLSDYYDESDITSTNPKKELSDSTQGRTEKEQGSAQKEGGNPQLPPGFEAPTEGMAGPSDWVPRCWREHDREVERYRARVAQVTTNEY